MKRAAVAVVLALLTGLAAGCTGDEGDSVATSSCERVLYEGEGKPDVIVVSDLPLRGVGARTTRLMVDAIKLVFRQRGFRAGEHRVGYQSCNDTVGDEPYDSLLCRQNARAYTAAEDIVGVIGPWNSGCAWEQVPIVSRKAAGPLAMISPANTNAGLTRTIRQGSGEALYPDDVRSYARVVTHDLGQGAGAAQLAAGLGARRVVVLQQAIDPDYDRTLADAFSVAGKQAGLIVRQFPWREQKGYGRLAAKVATARPDAVFLAGGTQLNAKQLVEDLRAELGPEIPLIAPDSFAASDVARDLGPAGQGMYVTVPGIPLRDLPPAGRRFMRALGRGNIEPRYLGAPEAAQAAEILLDAIGRSDGTRASVVEEVFATRVKNGILGSFTFDRFGDIVPAHVGIYRIRDRRLVTEGVVRARLDAVGG